MPACWIWGAVADSAEHMVKASDVRAIFPGLSQHAPAYRQSSVRMNEPVKGAQAPVLKFRPSLCQHCNNARSQPWDRAWEALGKGVREAKPSLRRGSRIPLNSIFPNGRRESMANVHRYLTKLMGCIAVEYAVPMPVASFANSLMTGVPEQSLRLVFVHIPSESMKAKIQVGHVQSLNGAQTGQSVTAVWHYVVGNLGVAVSYVQDGHSTMRLTARQGWHPTDTSCTWVLH